MDHSSVPQPLSIAEIDSKYELFKPFHVWANTVVDTAQWTSLQNTINEIKTADTNILSRAREVAKRAAAIDSGALEGLYEIDDGFTITVATQTAMWQAAYAKQADRTRELIEAQMAGYDEVIDLATKNAPLVEAWIRQLHSILCAAQKTYRVQTDQGEQDHVLPLGEYKHHPNHVVTKENKIHTYAPVLLVSEEMKRLVEVLQSSEFLAAHPIVQAAYVHYSVVWIHPFADGNGRVARALASVFTYRAASIPFMVLMEDKAEYLNALRSADKSDLQKYVRFVSARASDAFRMVISSMRAAKYLSPEELAERVRNNHRTKGGYVHAEIDTAGKQALGFISEALQNSLSSYTKGGLSVRLDGGFDTSSFPPPSGKHRRPVDPNLRAVAIRLESNAPAQATVVVQICFMCPVDASPDDEIMILTLPHGDKCGLAVGTTVPKLNTVAKICLNMFLREVMSRALGELDQKSLAALKKSGFG